MDRAIEDISDIAVLSPTVCLIFRGWRSVKEGFSAEELQQIIERINGQYIWAGKNALVVGIAVTLAESWHILAKARNFIRTQKLQKMATPSASPTLRDARPSLTDALPRGRGKGWRADKHFTKMVAANNLKNLQHKGDERMQCLLHAAAGPSPMTSDAESGEEPYESAMDYGATTDASPYEAYDSEEELDDVVVYDTETSHLTTVTDRNRQRKKQQQHRDQCEKKKQRECRARGVTLPLFKNSMKEGAMTYIDWHNSVDELVQDKVGVEHIKSLVLQSLEGPLKDTARLANKRGKGTLADILLVLDKAYGRLASYIHLQLELCNIQQMYKESAQDYFEWMVQLQVVIQDKYPTRLKDTELEWMAQEAYFNGLRDEFKPRVAYMLDNPGIKVTDSSGSSPAYWSRHRTVHCIQRQDASYYPASTSAKLVYQKDQRKDSNGKHNHNRGVINAKPAQIESDPSSEEEDPEEAERQRIAWRKCNMVRRILHVRRCKGRRCRHVLQHVLQLLWTRPQMERLFQASEARPTGSEG